MLFQGDVRDPSTKSPNELACHDALHRINALNTVVPLREIFRRGLINDDNKSYRMYMPWCPHGDLKGLNRTHIINGTPVPEAMVWYVAECLVECGIAMENGSLGGKVPGWVEIIHR